MAICIFQIIVSLVGYSLCEETPKYPENTADISSINNLAYKPPITLDPKIRKALLNVLNRLEEQEKTTESGAVKSSTEKSEQKAPLSDDVKWEYKANDTFKEYNYYEIVQQNPLPTTSKPTKDEPSSNDNFKEFNYYGIIQHKQPPTTPKPTKDDPSSNDNVKEFKYYEIFQHKPLPNTPQFTKDESSSTDEPGALFFQTPEHQKEGEPEEEKHESLNLQETKSALTPDDIFSHLEDEIIKEQKNTKSNDSTSSPKPNTSEDGVEVFQAPLLTAFTLEQDERGLPRRIIPLDIAELSSILDNKIYVDPSQEPRKAREPNHAPDSSQGTHILDPSNSQTDQKRYQLNLESQLLELQEQKRQLDLEKQRFLIEQEKQKLLIEQENARRLKLGFELREKENFLRSIKHNEIPRQEIAFQKSIPFEIYNKPVIVQPALPFIQFKPRFEFPDTVDRQLQNLFLSSGITQGKHEDLNIVSKVLALNYDDKDKPKISTERILNVHENFRNKRRQIDNWLRN